MKRKPKPAFAYAAIDKRGRINPWWIRGMAKEIREEASGWTRAKKMGYRIKKVRVEICWP